MFKTTNAALFAAGLFLSAWTGVADAATSADGSWVEVSESSLPARSAQQRRIVPNRYRVFALQRARLEQVLRAAPLEGAASRAADSTTLLELPLPDGSYGRFRVVESPIMEPALAAKYPQIHTYVAQGVDDPAATARIDVTPQGFHAQVLGSDGTTYVDPYRTGDDENYIAYAKRDYTTGQRGTCAVTGSAIEEADAIGPVPDVSSGAQLRTYRLAMGATGEYTQFQGGTKLDALSAIVTTMNRVNGIYEREVSVRMVLVANTDQIIFTDASTDGYTNNDGNLLIDEIQAKADSVIGNANYDIGHVVSTGGGGIAGLGVVCITGQKGSGVTGSPAPVADAYDVDYVAHEMGHQFAGDHTFNGAGGSCAGANRTANSAYEPGSGVTIQAYAGICGGDNLQPNSEDYFHRRSLNQILAYTTTGSGGTCGTTSATLNSAPGVPTLPPTGLTIPALTPFALTASATDPDGDALTYIWEQFDLGARNTQGVLDPTRTTGPMFRSFAPSRDASRTFPSWRYILNNPTPNIVPNTAPLPGTTAPNRFTGEKLPNANRNLSFRVTVRDNRAGGGGTNEASYVLAVTTAAGPFAVTAPNTATSLAAGAATTVTWNVANTTAAPVSTANVRITLSTDGGLTWPVELAASTANDGSESVTIPANLASTQARVRVEAVGNVYFDVSDVDFTITNGNTPPSITGIASLAARQGAPASSGVVANVSDAQDAAGALAVSVSGAPPELAVAVQNVGGVVTLTATAECGLVAPTFGTKAYPLQLLVTDSAGAVRAAEVVVNVAGNRTPEIGSYLPLNLPLGGTRVFTSTPFAGDLDGNLVSAVVTPTSLPGGGTVGITPDGTLTVATVPGSTLTSTPVRITFTDSCGAIERRDLTVNVANPLAIATVVGSQVTSGNTLLEPAECNDVTVTVRNDGNIPMTGVSVALATIAANVNVYQGLSAFPDIPPGEARTNTVPYQLGTSAGLGCYSNVSLTATVSYAQPGSPATGSTSLFVGAVPVNYVFTSSGGATLPSDTVLVAGSQGDDNVVDVVAPFAFSIYDTNVAPGTVLRASDNGNLQLRPSGGGIDWVEDALPTIGAGSEPDAFPANAPTLFLQWTDWNMAAGQAAADAGIYQKVEGTAPNRSWIIEWRGHMRSDGVNANNNRAAIVLHEGSSSFDYVYVATGIAPFTNAAFSTIGVQAAGSGTKFTQFAFDDANIAPGTKLTAAIPAPVCGSGSGTCTGTPAATLAQSGGTTNVVEGGATDTYTIVLASQPTGNVVVTPTPDAQVAVSPSTLTFTTLDWAVPQTITVTAVDDAAVEGAHTGNVAHAAVGGGYDAVVIPGVTVDVDDNDFADDVFKNGFE